jgi:O-antigen/teichoic acid export membrane protein
MFGILSQAIGGGLFFLVALLIARYLGPDRFGAFSFVFAFVTVFHMLADLGLTNILIREISRYKQQVDAILGAVIPLVSLLALVGFGAIALSVQFLRISAETEQAMFIMGLSVLVTFHAAVYGAVSRAFEEMGYNAVGLIVQRLLLLAFIMLALYLDSGLPGIALCYLGERIIQWGFFYALVRLRYARYRWRYDPGYWRYLIREAVPVGASMVLRRISWYVDTFMLMALSTASSVGLFSAAYRVIQMINVIPFTLSVPLFPALSRQAVESSVKAYALYTRAQMIFLLLGLPIGVWIILLGPQLMLLLFGEDYRAAGTTLQFMGLVVVFLFLNSLYVYLFSALGKQKLYMASIGISVLINVVLDFIFIPILDILGAALATLCAEVILYLSGILLLARLGYVMAYSRFLFKPLLVTLLASLTLVWPLLATGWTSLILGSLGYGGIFFLLAYAMNILTQDEIAALRAALPQGKRKVEGKVR